MMKNSSNIQMVAARLALSIPFALASIPALAQTQLTDEASGLSIQLPAGYTVTKAPPRPRQDVVFTIRSEANRPVAKNRDGSLCGLAFSNATANASLSQEEINETVRKPEWRNVAKATLETVFDVKRMDGITLNGIEGMAIQTAPKASLPDQDVFMHMSILETPKGRTTLVCVTDKANAQAALPVFESFRAGVQPPR